MGETGSASQAINFEKIENRLPLVLLRQREVAAPLRCLRDGDVDGGAGGRVNDLPVRREDNQVTAQGAAAVFRLKPVREINNSCLAARDVRAAHEMKIPRQPLPALEEPLRPLIVCKRHVFASDLLHFFFNDTATTEIYTLSLHDALPIYLKISEYAVVAQKMALAFRQQKVVISACEHFPRD